MQVILFAQTLFGLWFAVRTLQFFRARALIKTSTVTKTGTVFVSAILLIAYFCKYHEFLRSIALIGAVTCNLVALATLEWRQINILTREFTIFLDRWILNLKLGHGTSTACELALQAQTDVFRALIQPIFAVNAMANPNRRHILISVAVTDELRKMAAEPHMSLTRLEVLRVNLRQIEQFRRKSGQATQQTRIQAVVMMLMLIALIGFTIHRYGPNKMIDLIAIALTLATCGVFTMLLLARSIKWKI